LLYWKKLNQCFQWNQCFTYCFTKWCDWSMLGKSSVTSRLHRVGRNTKLSVVLNKQGFSALTSIPLG